MTSQPGKPRVDVVDTVVARVLDHIGLPRPQVKRWMENERGEP
jgi:3-polyprenyl-4-hydroxybenzoate decarboxylase